MSGSRDLDLARYLNPEQIAAVTHGEGPQLVLAGAIGRRFRFCQIIGGVHGLEVGVLDLVGQGHEPPEYTSAPRLYIIVDNGCDHRGKAAAGRSAKPTRTRS